MSKHVTLIAGTGEAWLGKLLEYPEVMPQGERLDELEENIQPAYPLIFFCKLKTAYEMKEIAV